MKPPLLIAMLVVSLDEAATARSATPNQLPSRAASVYRADPRRGSGFFAIVRPPHAAASVSSAPCIAAARALRGGGRGDVGGAKVPQGLLGGKETAALDGNGLGASKPRGENTHSIEPAQQGLENTAVVDVADKNTAGAAAAEAEAAQAEAAVDVHKRGKGLRTEGGDIVGNAKGSSVGGGGVGGGGGGGGGSDHHEQTAAVGRKPPAAAAAGAAAARKHEHVDAKEGGLREALLVADGANK